MMLVKTTERLLAVIRTFIVDTTILTLEARGSFTTYGPIGNIGW